MHVTDAVPSPFMHDWVSWHARRTPAATAILTPTVTLSYADLDLRVRALSARLAADGLRPDDRVLVALPNLPAAVVVGLAITALGALCIEVNRAWGTTTLGAIARTSRATRAFVAARDARMWSEALPGTAIHQLWVVDGTASNQALRAAFGGLPLSGLREDGELEPGTAVPTDVRLPELPPDHPTLVLYTSGSTGTPQGVVQTARNIDANSRSIAAYLDLSDRDRALLTLPLYYCYGRSVLQTHLLVGGSVFLEHRSAFPRTVMESLVSAGCTGFAGVPLTFEILRRQLDVASMDFSSLRYVTQAGGAMAADTIAWSRTAFQPAHLFVMYGQTEATARLAYLPPEHAQDKAGSIGIPIPGVQLSIVDAGGTELASGEVGHLVARGENVTSGYLDDPVATAAILHDGWLWTGDLAYRDDDGFFFHRGRAKEILKIGGHRVSPVEIEQVIASHPDVLEAAVCGVPDQLMGEVAGACFVTRAETDIGEPELRRYCQARLPAHAVPVGFVKLDSLPRNEAGKLLRAELPVLFTQARNATPPTGARPV